MLQYGVSPEAKEGVTLTLTLTLTTGAAVRRISRGLAGRRGHLTLTLTLPYSQVLQYVVSPDAKEGDEAKRFVCFGELALMYAYLLTPT